jgi:hypothetical protein
MNKRTACLGAVAATACLLVWTCGKKSGPSGPEDNGEPGVTYSYDTNGATINITIPEHTDTSRYCIIDSLVVEYDFFPAGILAWLYAVNGSVLTVIDGNDTASYTRSGAGIGLTGSWTLNGTNDLLPVKITFTATTVSLVYQKCRADEFIAFDWAPDSAAYAVSLQKVSCTEVRLTGDTTRETVTISWNGSGDKTTSSSDPAHAAHTWYADPVSCPNDEYPDWYYSAFLNDNYIQ